jgi:hypothetical protein
MEHTMSSKKKSAGFDLASRYASESRVVVITDPVDGKTDTGLRVEIGSIYTNEARAAYRALALVKDGAKEQPIEDTFVEQTIAVTRRWWDVNGSPDGIVIDGELHEATPDTVRAVYTDPRTSWVQRQVQAAYLDFAGFFVAPKTA